MANVAFLGLGVMGFPMAGHLSKAGHTVRVWNRTAAKAQTWAEQHQGQACHGIADAVADADCVLMCLGDDPDVRAVAPVSGGQAGAENGQLSIMCGGDDSVFAKAEPIMGAYAKAMVHAGPAGAGQLTKMVNQICIAGLVQGLAEGLHFAKSAGLDPETVISAVSKGAAQSWQMENRWRTMVDGEFDFGFAVNWMRKDLRIALDEARNNGARLPAAALVDQFYAEIEAMGGGRWDTSSLIARLENAERT